MPDFKIDIGGTDFTASQRTVHGPEAFNQKTAQQAEAISNFVQGVGGGFAAEKGEQQLGGDESQAEATAVVEAAFAFDPATSGATELAENEPTADQVGQRKREFLARADLNDRRLQAALDAGAISSAEANNRRLQNRKEFAANPLSALFISSYDQVVGGGSSGAARTAFFGKTPAELGRDAAIKAQATQAQSDIFIAEELVRTGKVANTSLAVGFIQEQRANTIMIEALKQRETISQQEAFQIVDFDIGQQLAGDSQTFTTLLQVQGGLQASDMRDWELFTATQLERGRLQIERANLNEADQARAMKSLTDTYTTWTAQLENAGYSEFYDNVVKDIESADGALKSMTYSKILRSNPGIFTVWEKLGPELGKMFLDSAMDPTKLTSAMTDNSVIGKAIEPFLTEEQKSASILDAVNSIMGGKAPPVEGSLEMAAGEAALSNADTLTPVVKTQDAEELEATLATFKGAHIGDIVNTPRFRNLIKDDPAKEAVIMTSLARSAKLTQRQSGLDLPTNIRVETLHPEEAASGDFESEQLGRQARNKKLVLADGEISPRMVSDISSVERYARENPRVWQDSYGSVNSYLNSLFGGTAPLPKDQTSVEGEPTKAVIPEAEGEVSGEGGELSSNDEAAASRSTSGQMGRKRGGSK